MNTTDRTEVTRAQGCLCCHGLLGTNPDPRQVCDECLGYALAGIRHQHTEER